MKTTPIDIKAYNLLHQGVLALAQVEKQGMRVDLEYCERQKFHLTRQIKRLEVEFQDSDLVKMGRRAYGKSFNIASSEQLADVLFNPKHMNIKPISFTDGDCNVCGGESDRCPRCWGEGRNPSTDEEALDALGVEGLSTLVRIRKLKKMRDTYIEGFVREQVDGVVHPIFNLNLARTYRPSTSDPNLANIPKRDPEAQKICRRALKASPGNKILSADFKGIEVGISCCYNHDPRLIKYYSDKTTDMHKDMAVQLYILEEFAKLKDYWKTQSGKSVRHSGKNEFVFPEFYGDYYLNCSNNLWLSAHKDTHRLPDGTALIDHLYRMGIRDLDDFVEHVKKVEKHFWGKRFKVYSEWKEEWREDYYKRGYFDSLTGFRYQGVMDRNQIINYPIQGSAFHCLLQVLIWIVEDSIKERWESRVCNQIYDDVMVDLYPKEEQMVRDRIKKYSTERLPEHWKWINVPMEVDIETSPVNGSWYEKESA